MFIYFLLTFIPVGYFNYKLYNKLKMIHMLLFKLDKKLNYYLTYQYYIPDSINNLEKNKDTLFRSYASCDIHNLCTNSDVIISNSSANNTIHHNNSLNCLDCSNYNICENCKLLDENKIYLIL